MFKKILSLASICLAVYFVMVFGFMSPTLANADTVIPSYVFTRDLTVGSSGADVIALQTAMVSLGDLVMPIGVPMGYFGNLTQAAVAKWQASVGISPAVGYFGPISRGYVFTHGFGISYSTVPGCLPGYMFSPLNGAPCTSSGNTVPGCLPGYSYSPITGQPCDVTVPPIIIPPPGATPPPGVYSLTLTKAGNGGGSVTSNVGGVNCSTTCSVNINAGTVLTLTAFPASGSTFGGWSGPCAGTGTCTVTMNANTSVTAIFNKTSVVTGGNALVETDVAYGTDSKQKVDVWYNSGYTNAPIALLVHGGSWEVGDKTDMTAIASKAFYPAGYVAMTVNYRLMNSNTLQNDWPTGVNDVACAVAWAKANASKYGGDPNKVVLYGQSAGSHLSGMVAFDPEGGWLTGCQTQGQTLNVVGYMGSGGVYDFTKVRADQRWQPGCLLERYLGLTTCGPHDSSWGNADPAKLIAASPVGHVSAGDPQSLIINGQADCYVNYPDPATGLCQANSISMDAALTSAGVPHTLYSIPGYSHGDFLDNFGANPANFPIALNFINLFK